MGLFYTLGLFLVSVSLSLSLCLSLSLSESVSPARIVRYMNHTVLLHATVPVCLLEGDRAFEASAVQRHVRLRVAALVDLTSNGRRTERRAWVGVGFHADEAKLPPEHRMVVRRQSDDRAGAAPEQERSDCALRDRTPHPPPPQPPPPPANPYLLLFSHSSTRMVVTIVVGIPLR